MSTARLAAPLIRATAPVARGLVAAVLVLACSDGAEAPRPGVIAVEVSTAGAIEPAAYVVSVDSGVPRPVSAGGGLVLGGVAAGSHRLTLGSFPSYCAVSGGAWRDVVLPPGDTVRVTFAVTCTPRAAVTVAVTTTGLSVDPDGYTVLVDSAPQAPVGTNASAAVSVVAPSTVRVSLGGVADNCAVDGGAAVVTAAPEASLQVAFAVTCRPVALTNQLLFVSTRAGRSQLYAMNADGSGQVRLTTDSVSELAPRLSPNGRLVFYQRAVGSDRLRVITTAGSPVAAFVGSYVAVGPWSPDGAYISHVQNAGRLGQRAVVVRTSDWRGAGSYSLGNSNGAPGPAAWSPDAATLLIHDNLGWPAAIGAVDMASGAVSRLTPADRSFADHDPAWAPSGRRIAFLRMPYPSNSTQSGRRDSVDVYTMNPDGSGVVRLTNHPGEYSSPQWSPDGSKIAFVSTRGGSADVWIMNADGSGLVNLTSHPAEDASFVWAPSGDRIAFTTDRDGNKEVYAVRLDGTGLVNLTRSPGDDYSPQWAR